MEELMKRTFRASLIAVILMVFVMTTVAAASVTPSTNDDNKTKGWAYVEVVASGPGTITLQFVSTRLFASCFEYRTDGDTSQMTSATNYNPGITDGLYPAKCVNNSTRQVILTADSYVEVRMVFGAEGDERFGWTTFSVPPVTAAVIAPVAAPVINWIWNKSIVSGEEIPMWKLAAGPHSWEQLMSKGLKINAAVTICWPFREGQFGWTGRIYQLAGETWTPLATTIAWTPNGEGRIQACSKAPSAGTYALFGFWQPD
jgi:hypothetical protein